VAGSTSEAEDEVAAAALPDWAINPLLVNKWRLQRRIFAARLGTLGDTIFGLLFTCCWRLFFETMRQP